MRTHSSWRVPWSQLAVALIALSGGEYAFAAVDPITGAEPAEGFGASATGGRGNEQVIATNVEDLAQLKNRSNVYIKVQGKIVSPETTIFTGSNVTIDGEGTATICGTATPSERGQRLLEFTGKNIVIKRHPLARSRRQPEL